MLVPVQRELRPVLAVHAKRMMPVPVPVPLWNYARQVGASASSSSATADLHAGQMAEILFVVDRRGGALARASPLSRAAPGAARYGFG